MIKVKQTCKKCKGTGKEINIDPVLAVCSFGMTAILDITIPDDCPHCNGFGYYILKIGK